MNREMFFNFMTMALKNSKFSMHLSRLKKWMYMKYYKFSLFEVNELCKYTYVFSTFAYYNHNISNFSPINKFEHHIHLVNFICTYYLLLKY
jgi:hypothetical protein